MIDEDCLDSLDKLSSSVEKWNQNIDKLRLWYHYSMSVLKIKDYDVNIVIQYYLQGHSGKETADAFRRGYYMVAHL